MASSPVTLDRATLTATIGARRARLTRREFAVLEMLCAAHGQTVTHHELLATIWGPHSAMPNLRMAIVGLRRKLEADPDLPSLIVTEPGAGYRLGRP